MNPSIHLALLTLTASVALAGLATGCSRDAIQRADSLPPLDEEAPADGLDLELADWAGPAWIERSSPAAASPGYNLVLYRRRVPVLMDLSGAAVHAWPNVRAAGRARLNHHGDLLVIGTDNRVKVYDWEGVLRFAWAAPAGVLLHHDVRWSRRGTLLVLAVERVGRRDSIRELSYAGEVTWSWRAHEHVPSELLDATSDPDDSTHLNSVQELPPNPHDDAGDERFRPGNLLVSARNLSSLFVVERSTGRVVWHHASGLDHQHEAAMIPRGADRAGRILVFDNGLANRRAYRRSRVVEIDPANHETTWAYEAPYFYTSVGGSQQLLPNGNVLLTSSQGGRVFEVTREGEIVWQWTPPFLPMRALRYAKGYSDAFRGFERAGPEPVAPRLGRPYIDRELSSLAVPGDFVNRVVFGANRAVLLPGVECREVLVPPRATLRTGFGLREPPPDRPLSARIVLRARVAGQERVEVLLDESIRWNGEPDWHQRAVPISFDPFSRIELCLERTVRLGSRPATRRLVMGNAVIQTADTPRLPAARKRARSEAEWRQIEAQLDALGYAN